MIESNKLRRSAGHHEARCMLNIANVCDPRGGVMLCHIRLAGDGMSMKPDDTRAAFGCKACHDIFDGRVSGLTKNSPDWLFYALRGMARTVSWWIEHGYLVVTK